MKKSTKDIIALSILAGICAISGIFGALTFLITTASALLVTGAYIKITTTKDALKTLKENEAKAIHFEDYEPKAEENIPTKIVEQDGLNQLSYNFSDEKEDVIEK